MPIQWAKKALNPKEFLPSATTAAADECWWQIHIHSRPDKVLVRELYDRKCTFLQVFSPLREHHHAVGFVFAKNLKWSVLRC